MNAIIVDTGPLVAYLVKREEYHEWAVDVFSQIHSPLRTCEPVLTEVAFLLSGYSEGADPLFALLDRGLLQITYRISKEEIPRLRVIMKQYRNLPASLADACLIRMSEESPDGKILTLDSHFRIYRKSNRHVIPAIMP